MEPPGLRMDSNSLTVSPSFSRACWVWVLFGTSTSSAMISSARVPVSCPKIPTDLTEGAWSARAGATSKAILDSLWSARGARHWRTGISLMSRRVKVEKSSDRDLDAETTRKFSCGSMRSFQHTYALVIHDFPTPRKPSMIFLLGPY